MQKILFLSEDQEVDLNGFPPRRYYCTTNGFVSVDDHERHVVTRHPNLPGYPGPAVITFYGLQKQGMSWEHDMKNDIEWR